MHAHVTRQLPSWGSGEGKIKVLGGRSSAPRRGGGDVRATNVNDVYFVEHKQDSVSVTRECLIQLFFEILF